MPWTSEHIDNWLVPTGRWETTEDDREVELWEFVHNDGDDDIMSAWAQHFRNHYCSDSEIDELRDGLDLSRKDYLEEYVFPGSQSLGPSIRAGDFAEILVADYLEFKLGYLLPRFRYAEKISRNESVKGADVVGFKIITDGEVSEDDEMITFEVKSKFSGNAEDRLQKAIDGSVQDYGVRTAATLNAYKRRCLRVGDRSLANKIKRFQNKTARPYREISGAAAVYCDHVYDVDDIHYADAEEHPNQDGLRLIVITGDQMMNLVHKLYQRAANEA